MPLHCSHLSTTSPTTTTTTHVVTRVPMHVPGVSQQCKCLQVVRVCAVEAKQRSISEEGCNRSFVRSINRSFNRSFNHSLCCGSYRYRVRPQNDERPQIIDATRHHTPCVLTSNNIIAPPSLDNRNKQQNAFGSRLELEVVAGRDAGRKEASGGRAGRGMRCDNGQC